ncbi:hypothetical protein SCA03_13820 [Streptomyces cacaoi]|uniref:Uncharacterized protein n=1 Tax=Streptomyces cacaoi TaxID=1898 RepID=A0A4Y3QUC1_STRCI|nr:hypothetical protein SCA03_13820 [Streptomyces cacaoi]
MTAGSRAITNSGEILSSGACKVTESHQPPVDSSHFVTLRGGHESVVSDTEGGRCPMAEKPEGHCRRCEQDRWYRRFRWMGPAYTLYKIVREHWPL